MPFLCLIVYEKAARLISRYWEKAYGVLEERLARVLIIKLKNNKHG
jgi:hypothetical protein